MNEEHMINDPSENSLWALLAEYKRRGNVAGALSTAKYLMQHFNEKKYLPEVIALTCRDGNGKEAIRHADRYMSLIDGDGWREKLKAQILLKRAAFAFVNRDGGEDNENRNHSSVIIVAIYIILLFALISVCYIWSKNRRTEEPYEEGVISSSSETTYAANIFGTNVVLRNSLTGDKNGLLSHDLIEITDYSEPYFSVSTPKGPGRVFAAFILVNIPQSRYENYVAVKSCGVFENNKLIYRLKAGEKVLIDKSSGKIVIPDIYTETSSKKPFGYKLGEANKDCVVRVDENAS